jgi:hypothetical protein
MAFAETSVDAAPGGSYLLITGSGADRRVRSLNLPQLGRSLVYRRERENSVCTFSQTVPVRFLKK